MTKAEDNERTEQTADLYTLMLALEQLESEREELEDEDRPVPAELERQIADMHRLLDEQEYEGASP